MTLQLTNLALDAPYKKRAAALLAAALLALSLLAITPLTGCNSKAGYVGTWDLKSTQTADSNPDLEPYPEEYVTQLFSAGQTIYLTLTDNNEAIFNELGTITNGTWAQAGGGATIDFDTQEILNPTTGEVLLPTNATLALKGGELTMTRGKTTWTFKKGEAKTPYVKTEDGAEDGTKFAEAIQESTPLEADIDVADDDNVQLVINANGITEFGDLAYSLSVKNKGKQPISVWIPDPVKVAGKEIPVIISMNVEPGQILATPMVFDQEKLGSNQPNAASGASGIIRIDDASGNEIGSYTFTLP